TATRCRVGLEDIAEDARSVAGAPTAFNVATRVRAAAASRGSARQGLVDRLLERAGVLRVLNPPPVDEERGSAVHSHRHRLPLTALAGGGRLAAGETPLQPRHVEAPRRPDLLDLCGKVLLRDLRLLPEQPVVNLPELIVALLECARRRHRRVLRPGVDLRERHLLEHEPHLVLVLRVDFLLEELPGAYAVQT